MPTSLFSLFTSLVSITGFYSKDEPVFWFSFIQEKNIYICKFQLEQDSRNVLCQLGIVRTGVDITFHSSARSKKVHSYFNGTES